jgi:hypothetical protein
MASGTKSSSVFTGNPMGGSAGDSDMIDTKSGGNIGGGGKIKSAYPQDNVHGLDLPNTKGGKMGGSPTNLAHSLSGASAVQRQSGKVKSGI